MPVVAGLRALCAVAFLVAAVAALPATAFAQTNYDFHLPAQALPDALRAIGSKASVNVVFEPSAVRGKRAPGLQGSYSVQEALARLLNGSGLSVRVTDGGSFVIESTSPARVQKASSQVDNRELRLVRRDTPATGQYSDASAAAERPEPEAQEITVTGTNIRGAKTIAAPSITITREEIERDGYATVEDLMEKLPQNFTEIRPEARFAEGGSRLARLNEDRASGIDLRGLGSQSTLTLVNGKRRAGSNLGRVTDISTIPLSAIERVEIVTGGRSAVYGSDAVAGVVNLVTRRDFEGFETRAQYGLASAGGERLQLNQTAGMKSQRWGFMLAYDYRHDYGLDLLDTGLVISPLPSGNIKTYMDLLPPADQHSALLSGRFSWSDNVELYADAMYTSKRSESLEKTLYSGADNESWTRYVIPTEQYNASAGAVFGIGSWALDTSAAVSLIYTETFSAYALDFGDFFIASESIYDRAATLGTASMLASGPLFAIGGIVPQAAVGVERRKEGMRNIVAFRNGAPNGLVVAHSDRHIDSVSAEVLLPLVENGTQPGLRGLEISLAGRYDDYSDFGSTVNPQVGVVWAVADEVTVRAAYSTAFRVPPLTEVAPPRNEASLANRTDPLSGGSTAVLTWDGTNPGLGPEKARTWSFGVDFRPAFMPQGRVSLSYFNVEYKDRIETPAFGGTDQALVLVREDRFTDVVHRDPSADLLAAVLATDTNGIISNGTGTPFDPATQNILDVFPNLVLFDNRTNNLSVEKVDGIDLIVDNEFLSGENRINAGFNGSFTLGHDRRLTENSPPFDLYNEVGKAVDLRLRAKLGWSRRALGATVFVNYVDSYSNPFPTPAGEIEGWTTADVVLRLDGSKMQGGRWLQGFAATLSINNALDQDPPEFLYSGSGLRYDASNANPLGRYMSLQFSKNW